MASHVTDNYTSDNDQVSDDQIQYTYLDGEIAPVEELENHDLGVVDIEEYERIRDQAEDLDNRNWELKMNCKVHRMELRILKRSTFEKVQDRLCYWKEWTKWMFRQATGNSVLNPTSPRYEDILEARYYPHDLHLE